MMTAMRSRERLLWREQERERERGASDRERPLRSRDGEQLCGGERVRGGERARGGERLVAGGRALPCFTVATGTLGAGAGCLALGAATEGLALGAGAEGLALGAAFSSEAAKVSGERRNDTRSFGLLSKWLLRESLRVLKAASISLSDAISKRQLGGEVPSGGRVGVNLLAGYRQGGAYLVCDPSRPNCRSYCAVGCVPTGPSCPGGETGSPGETGRPSQTHTRGIGIGMRKGGREIPGVDEGRPQGRWFQAQPDSVVPQKGEIRALRGNARSASLAPFSIHRSATKRGLFET